ncbi:FMN-binding protein [Microbacterium sp. P01]|uniref:FMN-binding protein n=1 Tax=unclassified Microbacterium TaxID=2609290 RepID=UPI00366C0FF4
MIRFQEVPRPARVGAALVGVAGMLALAGCSTTPAAEAESTTDTSASAAPSASASSTGSATTDAAASGSAYVDGSYTAEGSYSTPESVEQISVTVTLADDVITAVEVTGDPQKSESKEYQSKFIGGISDVVVGKSIDEISVDRVAGSSLTSSGFNQAIEEIKSEAAA